MSGRGLLLAAALVVGPAGCATDAQPASEPRPEGSASSTPAPSPEPTVRANSPSLEATPTATPPVATAPSAPSPPTDAGESEGHAGADEVARTPVRVVVDAEGVMPPRTAVPAFLAVRLTVRNDLPRAISVSLGDASGRVRARGRRSFDVGGLRRGPHPIDAGVAGRATVDAR